MTKQTKIPAWAMTESKAEARRLNMTEAEKAFVEEVSEYLAAPGSKTRIDTDEIPQKIFRYPSGNVQRRRLFDAIKTTGLMVEKSDVPNCPWVVRPGPATEDQETDE